jgi:hypothetical protein
MSRRVILLCGLLATLVMTWLASHEDAQDDMTVAPVTMSRNERAGAAQPLTVQRGQGFAGDFLNSAWPTRAWVKGPVPDVFTESMTPQGAPAAGSKTVSQVAEPPPPSVESKFAFRFAGKLQESGSVKIFLEGAAQEVIQLVAGDSFGVDWRLQAVQTDHLVIEHKPSGKLFHLQTGS